MKKANLLLKENYFALLLVRKGKIDLKIKSDTILLLPGELIFLPEETFSMITMIHGQPFMGMVLFSSRFAFGAIMNTTFPIFLIFLMFRDFSKLRLETHEIYFFILLMNLLALKSKDHKDLQPHHHVLELGFFILLWELRSLYRYYTPDRSFPYATKHMWVMRFFDALRTYYKREHQVQFYADKLHVNSRYLSRSVKEVSGKTAKRFLRDLLLQEAKMLLYDPVSIKVISHTLGFNSVQHFSNFFKRHTTLSPTAFRERLNEKSIL